MHLFGDNHMTKPRRPSKYPGSFRWLVVQLVGLLLVAASLVMPLYGWRAATIVTFLVGAALLFFGALHTWAIKQVWYED